MPLLMATSAFEIGRRCWTSPQQCYLDCLRTLQLCQTKAYRSTNSKRYCYLMAEWSEMMKLHTHTHPFNGPLSGTTRVSRYQKGETNLDFTEARDSEWQWHQLGHMQACTSLQTDNHTSTPPLSFLQAGCPSCHPTNSVKVLKATEMIKLNNEKPTDTRMILQ